jgi:lipopolysaccharide transport system ATP-binding protein
MEIRRGAVTTDAIRFDHVTKSYAFALHRVGGLKNLVLNLPGALRHMKAERHDVLVDVSFSVGHGESLGIIGRNGAGKSTLLALMAGVIRPTTGEVTVRGRVSPLLELGAGFHPELTGRENIMLNGVLLGLRRAEVSVRMDRIIAFSELEESIDEPIRVFSTGMLARLGFSVAAHLDPEILLIDEVLAVGDTAFRAKCVDKINEFRRRSVTTVLVSHNLDQVAALCDRAIVLEGHRVVYAGDVGGALAAYGQEGLS